MKKGVYDSKETYMVGRRKDKHPLWCITKHQESVGSDKWHPDPGDMTLFGI